MTKKIMALVLAAALTTGIGTYGTYAYLTDSDKVNDEVNITIGQLDIASYWAGEGYSEWTPVSGVTEVNEATASKLNFTNAKPGDKFRRDIIVSNMGTLEADVRMELNKNVSEFMDVKVDVADKLGANVESDENGMFVRAMDSNRKGWVRLTVEVTIKENVQNNQVIGGAVSDFLSVGAHQTIDN